MNNKTFRGKLLSLVLPITFQQLMVTVVSASDALMVGVIGQDLLSAVSLASQVTFVYNLFIAALTIGTSMFAAQYWGKGDRDSEDRDRRWKRDRDQHFITQIRAGRDYAVRRNPQAISETGRTYHYNRQRQP